jgi:transcriptional regulator with XRE-family HTH domain
MGVSVGRVSQIERGEVASVEVLGRYADAVGGRLRVVIDFGDELSHIESSLAHSLKKQRRGGI